MNTNQLLKWLGLPPGPWPPEDRVLLGLPPGPVDPFHAEKRALELMDRLRPHQLVNPDLVTEGMNRLAQALVAMSAAPARPTLPPQPIPSQSRPRTVLAPAPPRRGTNAPAVDFALPGGVEAAPLPIEPIEAEVVEAEVVEMPSAPAPKPSAPLPRPKRRRPPPIPLEPVEPAVVVPAFPPPPPGVFVAPADRRAAYRELASLRQLRRAWRKLRATLAVPSEGLYGPAEVCGYLEAVIEVRAALIRPEASEEILGPLGAFVRTVVRQPLALAVFRALVPAQRQALARDWAAGLMAIEARSGAVRRFLRDTRPPHSLGSRITQIGGWLLHNPEWLPVLLTVLAVVAALVRAASH